jgi:carbon-monoxide dehydrogenase iron sulfur subunit
MKKVYFNSRKCLGCHSCSFACAVEHSRSKDPLRAHLETDKPVARRDVRDVAGMCLTVACRHCDPAPCAEACISGAMRRNGAEVVCDVDRCVGCWMCVMVCPFDAVQPGAIAALKCDMCQDRPDDYVCVTACPTGALFAADAEEFRERLREAEAAK